MTARMRSTLAGFIGSKGSSQWACTVAWSALVLLCGCGGRAPNAAVVQGDPAPFRSPSTWRDLDPSRPGTRLQDPRTGIVFRRIPAGSFTMGSAYMPMSMPQHPVQISTAFLLAETEVTLGQWRSYLHAAGVPPTPAVQAGEDSLPAAVDHNGASAFCARYGYVLPTEAQWEWACLGGLSPSDPSWEDKTALRERAWYHDNAGDHARPVATRKPNGYGLHDMIGNLWEWCADYYAPFDLEERIDPKGPPKPFGAPPIGNGRVLRGGSWFTISTPAPNPHTRIWDEPASTTTVAGFRPACPID